MISQSGARIRRHPRRPLRSAFTLLEVMLVLVILAAIAGIAVVNIGGVQERAYIRTAKTELSNLKSMLEQYRLEVGSYPNKLEDLHTQPSDLADPSRWLQLLKEPPKPDPWGHPYEYINNGSDYELRSVGPDGKSGTEDDITA
ncbi:MAG: type II secretion system protein GspG [Planctomycetota bacterium]|nr:MAG: type II secretion system protein GspG [Planctomycetota bacterium]